MATNGKFDELVACFEKLPGVGKKSALRFAYYAGVQNPFFGINLANMIEDAVHGLRRCEYCGAICENEICEYCADLDRDGEKICIVESPKDIIVLESNKIFNGKYFVLDDVNDDIMAKLENMIEINFATELIFALTPGVNSDGIMLFIQERLKDKNLKFSKIAQGVPTGVSLDNVDMLSLIKAMNGRVDI